jgi:hypothetical protein
MGTRFNKQGPLPVSLHRPSDRDLVVLVADLKLEEPFIKDQFAARVADKPFTSELILFDWGGLEDHAVGSKNCYGKQDQKLEATRAIGRGHQTVSMGEDF